MKDNYDISKLSGKKGKKKVNSRAKGQAFERKVANLLNLKFKTKEFCRTPGSGAFATTHSLPDYLKIYGDLITPKNFKFSIECKKGYNEENLSSMFNPNSATWKFIKQSEKDSKNSGKLPLIIWQQDRSLILVITQANTFPDYLVNIHICGYRIYNLQDLLNLDNGWFLD